MKQLTLILIAVAAFVASIALSGCTAVSDSVQKISDDLGDKALNASALIDIWKITPSDPVTNSMPSGKKVTVIGNVSSVPVVEKEGESLKDYIEYEKTSTPAWYNKDNVTVVERLRWTTGASTELQKAFLEKFKTD